MDFSESCNAECILLNQALGTKLLPRLWAQLAGSMGLPLEAPREAKRGWNIASLRQGTQSLPVQHAALLGLFCRSANLDTQVWIGVQSKCSLILQGTSGRIVRIYVASPS